MLSFLKKKDDGNNSTSPSKATTASNVNMIENKSKEFDLNIEKILENWEVYHAIREIIANALDEQILTDTKEIEIYNENNIWHIRDFGRGLNYHHLTENENQEKLNNEKLIGRFGVGLKDALATLYRNNIKVSISSQYGTITLKQAQKFGFEDIITLHANIDEADDNQMIGTDFSFYGCSDEDIAKAKKLFLKFANHNVMEETALGEIIEKNNEAACIYINGVKVSEEPNFLFSYNITSLNANIKKALNRERTNVGRSAYSERIKSILLQAQNDCVINALTENLNEFSQGLSKDELKWTDVATHAARMLNSRKNVVFITPKEIENATSDYVDILKTSGKNVVFIPETVKEKVSDSTDDKGNEIATFTTVLKDYQDSFQYKFVDYSDLNSNEKRVFDLVPIIASIYHAEYLIDKVYISETIKPNIWGESSAGVWDASADKIIILRDQLQTIDKFAGTLIHELVHAYKNLPDVDRKFEIELTNIIGQLASIIIKKDKLNNSEIYNDEMLSKERKPISFSNEYKNMRNVLEDLTVDTQFRSKLNDYDTVVGGMLMYSINILVLNGSLTEEIEKQEYINLLAQFEISIADATYEEMFYIMKRKSDWYNMSQELCKYNVEDMGQFWQAVVLMGKLCKDLKRITAFLVAYAEFMIALANYLNSKYNCESYLTQVNSFLIELIPNVEKYANKG